MAYWIHGSYVNGNILTAGSVNLELNKVEDLAFAVVENFIGSYAISDFDAAEAVPDSMVNSGTSVQIRSNSTTQDEGIQIPESTVMINHNSCYEFGVRYRYFDSNARYIIGLHDIDNTPLNTFSQSTYFLQAISGGNWTYNVNNGTGSLHTDNTSKPAANTWTTLKIIGSGNTAEFYVNNSLKTTATTNIPGSFVRPIFGLRVGSIDLDWWYIKAPVIP